MRSEVVLRPPSGPVSARVDLPGSKSIANRALVAAFLARGVSVIDGLPDGDDTEAMLAAFDDAGALAREGDTAMITGGSSDRLAARIDARLAGTTSRFLTAVAATSSCPHVVDGGVPLRSRPMGPLHEAIVRLGGRCDWLGERERLPVSTGGPAMGGGRVTMRADVSSQFASALLLVGPRLPGGLVLELADESVSDSYVSMTVDVMERFGARVASDGRARSVEGSGYESTRMVVDADMSSAAFPVAAVLVRGGSIELPRLVANGLQGDERILDIARSMGATVSADASGVTVSRDASTNLAPVDVDLSDCSDLVPAVAVACLAARGRSRIRGVGFIRSKESNRIEGLADELGRTGARVIAVTDGLDIEGGYELHPSRLATLHDHRLAMAFAVLSLSCPGIVLDDAGVVSKSWPRFFSDMEGVLGPFGAER